MNITTKLTEKDFINASLAILISRLFFKIILGIAGLLLFISILPVVTGVGKLDAQAIITFVLMTFVLPVTTYFNAKKLYQTNLQMRETVVYTVADNQLIVSGETFSSTFPWATIYKVTQTKRWLLIWQNKANANPVPITELWGGQIADLKEILDRNGVKNNLNPTK